MEYWITNNDMNIWKVIQNGNSLKRTRRDHDGRVIILPLTTTDEHIVVRRESKARTTLLQSIPDDHVAGFHYMDGARDIWNAVKARFGGNAESKKMRKSMLKQEFLKFRIREAEGLHKGYDRMQKILSQLNQLKAKPEDEDINLKFLRALPSSWSQMSKDTLLFNQANLHVQAILHLLVPPVLAKRCHMEIVQVILQLLPTLLHQTLRLEQQLAYEDFKQIEKLDLEEMDLKWQMAMLSVRLHKFEQKAGRKIDFDKKESVMFNKKKVRCYKCQQRGHFARECKAKGGNDKQRYSSFKIKEIGKKEEDSKALITVDTLVDWTYHDEEASAAGDAGEFAPMGVTSEMSYGTKSLTSSDSKFLSNDFVSCDDSDKSSKVNTNDFAFSDSSVKSSEPKLNDSTSCASTSSVSTSENEAEIESNVRTPIQEPIIVLDLPSFSCNSFDKNENTSRTSCNKNGYFNKNAVPTGKPKVFAPVPTDRQNRPFPVPTDRGYSPSENPFPDAKDEGVFDSGCSRSMTGNKERLDNFQIFQGGKVTFGGGKGMITGKGTIRTPTLDFKNVYYVKELQQFNLFSISQICDKKNRVLFTDTECLVLSKDFKLPDESMVVIRVPRKHNLYTINLNNLCHMGTLAFLVAHASFDESVKWHRRMGHVNYKNTNRLVKGNLVRGLPPKLFKNDHTCVACCKGKQHKASYKAINVVSSISEPLQLLHMDLFGPTSIRSIDHKYYYLVITDDYSRVLVTSPHNKTPYALLTGNIPSVSHFKTFGCHVTILNTSDHLGKFDGKADKGYIVGYSASNKAYRVYNVPNKRVEETINMRFLEEKPNVHGLGHEWYCDLDYLTDTLGYKHVQANQSAGTQEAITNHVGTQDDDSDSDCDEQVIIVSSYPSHNIQGTEPKDNSGDEVDDSPLNSADEIFQKKLARMKGQEQRATSDAERLGLGFVNDAEEL
nr:ribonuclease H-like domain-containing protein [Tanacetum cinerariifolium]